MSQFQLYSINRQKYQLGYIEYKRAQLLKENILNKNYERT